MMLSLLCLFALICISIYMIWKEHNDIRKSEPKERFTYRTYVDIDTPVRRIRKVFADTDYYYYGLGAWINLGGKDRLERIVDSYVKRIALDGLRDNDIHYMPHQITKVIYGEITKEPFKED